MSIIALAKAANCYCWRSWQRRADTILRSIQALQSDMVAELGCQHEATDYPDNIMCEAEELSSLLLRLANASKRKHAASTPSPGE